MLFIGGIGSNVLKDLKSRVQPFKDSKFQILCSGKFTSEKMLLDIGAKQIKTCDISCLSMAIGAYINNEDIELEFLGEYKFLNDIAKKSLEYKIACLLFVYGGSDKSGKEDLVRKLAKKRYFDNSEKWIEENKNYFIENYKPLQGKIFFEAKDCVKVLKNSDEDSIILSFLPTYTKGYEKIFNHIENFVSYRHHAYTIIDDAIYVELHKEIISTRQTFFYTDRKIEGLDSYIVSKHDNKMGRDIYLYSNIDNKKSFFSVTEKTPIINIKDIVDIDNLKRKSKIEVFRCNHYDLIRERFISLKLKVLGGVDLSFLVKIDEKYVGAFAFKKYNNTFILLSDFVFINEKKISKLIPMLARSKEIIDYARLMLRCDCGEYIITQVQSKQAVSMKYRGIYELVRRDEKKECLIYKSKVCDKTLKEEYELWFDRYYNKSK